MALPNDDFETLMRTLGLCDTDQLGLINQEVIRQMKVARRLKGQQIKAQLNIFDQVRLPMNAKPQYLQGQTGVIVDIKDSRAHVKLDRGPQGKFRNGIVICPFSMLTIVEKV